mmetsp:Transcript_12293/g.26522  ORF Transcript_12293/g.26522 Transcript_12293/m.26522 type:complete len:376 (+) Transcript_12293:17-1144(+)
MTETCTHSYSCARHSSLDSNIITLPLSPYPTDSQFILLSGQLLHIPVALQFGDVQRAAQKQRQAQVQPCGRDVQDALLTVRSPAPSLLCQQAQWIGLVHQTKVVTGVSRPAPVDECAVEVGHEGAHVPRAVLLWKLTLALPDVVDIGLQPLGPVVVPCIIQAVDLPSFRDSNVWMSQHELPDAGVQGETMRSGAQRDDHHGCGAVQAVAGSHLSGTRLQHVCSSSRASTIVNPKDCSSGYRHLYVPRPIQGVKHHRISQVCSPRPAARPLHCHLHGVIVLLRRHHPHHTTGRQNLLHNIIRHYVQLLLGIPVAVAAASRRLHHSVKVVDTSSRYLGCDDLGSCLHGVHEQQHLGRGFALCQELSHGLRPTAALMA